MTSQVLFFNVFSEKDLHVNASERIVFDRSFSLFVACTSWRIPEDRSNRIFDCHPTRIFESFQGSI